MLIYNSYSIWVSYADVAQLAEQLTCNQQVIGSSPIIGFIYGWIPERPKGADCKSVAIASKVRILLRPSQFYIFYCRGVEQSGSSSGS